MDHPHSHAKDVFKKALKYGWCLNYYSALKTHTHEQDNILIERKDETEERDYLTLNRTVDFRDARGGQHAIE